MRIVIDLTPIYDHLTGIERYTINISKELIMAYPDDEYTLLFKNEVHNSFLNIVQQSNVKYVIIPECNKLLFIQWRLFRRLRKIKADYYLFLSFTSPVLFKRKGIVNAMHDLTCWDCPETIPVKMKYYYRFTYAVAAKISWKIVTVSIFSQGRICERFKLSKEKVPVIYDGLTDVFASDLSTKADIWTKYKLPEKYILSLSTIEPRKNLQLLIIAYKQMLENGLNLPDLVLAGRKGWKLEDILGDIDDNVKNRIHFTGFIDDLDLPQIYREAKLFVFPSKYEGFGLPVIEAMSQGTIVVCSDAASLPEIARDAGILFESGNVEDLKRAISSSLELPDAKRELLIQKGRAISRSYSWSNEAKKLGAILHGTDY